MCGGVAAGWSGLDLIGICLKRDPSGVTVVPFGLSSRGPLCARALPFPGTGKLGSAAS